MSDTQPRGRKLPKVYHFPMTGGLIFAHNYGNACRQAYGRILPARDQLSYKDFLKINDLRPATAAEIPDTFGIPVLVSGRPAALLRRTSANSFNVWIDGSDTLNSSHELDVETACRYVSLDPEGAGDDLRDGSLRFVYDRAEGRLVSSAIFGEGAWQDLADADPHPDLIIPQREKAVRLPWEHRLHASDDLPDWAASPERGPEP